MKVVSEFLDRSKPQHEPLRSVAAEVDGDDGVLPLVLRVDHRSQSETVMRDLISHMEIRDVEIIVGGHLRRRFR